MTSAMQVKEAGAAGWARWPHRPPRRGPGWLDDLRETAMGRFDALGFPTTRMEAWRSFSVAPIAERDFVIPSEDAAATGAAEVEPFAFTGLEKRLVFVNGRFNERLSSIGPPGAGGVQVLDLAEAARSEPVRRHLTQHADFENEAFTALNTALFGDGVFIHVPKGGGLDDPIHLLNLAVPQDAPTMTNPRLLVVAEEGSRCTIVEDFAAAAEGVYLTNSVTEFVVGDGAVATHYMLQRESNRAFNISTLQVHQGRESDFTSHTLMLGAALARNNVNPVLDGQGCRSLLNGLYVLDGDQTVDNHMRVDHARAHGDSRQHYKGIMSGRSHGIFRGRIIVRPDAQKTDAKQSNQNLLLSDDASVNSDPQLEIYADDVKCTHGSTTGRMDESAIFYLQTRGLPRDVARAMLVDAFASESLERMTVDPIRDHFKGVIRERLSCGDAVKGFQ